MITQGGKYIEVEPGVEIFVEDVGIGEPIIFIPGWTFTSEVFYKQVAHFRKTHRVIVMDPRSHGRSSITIHGNDYVTHDSDLAKVMDELKLKDVTLAGWSFGCLTMWEYIRQHGLGNIRSLVFVDLSPKPLSTNEQDWVEGTLDEIAGVYTTYLQSPKKQREFITGHVTDVMVQRALAGKELSWIVEQSLKTPYYIASNLFAAGMFSDYRKEAKLANTSVPTLTIIAEHWADVAKGFTEKHSPGSSIEILGGHMMFWEHEAKFNQILEQFLSGKDN